MTATSVARVVVACALLYRFEGIPLTVQTSAATNYSYVPDTISDEGQRLLLRIGKDPALNPSPPEPDDLKAWKNIQTAVEDVRGKKINPTFYDYGCLVSEANIGGTPVLDIRPHGLPAKGPLVIYIHGGAWVAASARSSLSGAARVANLMGRRVISVNYTLAPTAKWPQITDEIIAVVKGLVDGGISMREIAIFGDSAGGNLAAAVTLKMRDKGFGLPAAVVTWSLVSDFYNTADTRVTLRDADPAFLYRQHIKNAMLAYADEKDWKNPYVSPVYGDFKKGFPPTLIQAGTREILLSDAVRFYQAIEAAGGSAKLDIYEGMPHVFQAQAPDAPESKLALAKMKEFLDQHLGKPPRSLAERSRSIE